MEDGGEGAHPVASWPSCSSTRVITSEKGLGPGADSWTGVRTAYGIDRTYPDAHGRLQGKAMFEAEIPHSSIGGSASCEPKSTTTATGPITWGPGPLWYCVSFICGI